MKDGYVKILEHGFIGLDDHMGNDGAICRNAWVSTGKASDDPEEHRRLLAFLIAEDHTSPLERVDFVFHVRLPIFVARQWIRHRMSSVNEYSGRYSPMRTEFEVPAELSPEMQARFRKMMEEEYKLYLEAMDDIKNGGEKAKRARETARGVLGTGFYTEWYWKANLHSISHFLYLRCAKDAQYEIRLFADAMASLIQPIVPISAELIEQSNRMKWALKEAKRKVLCKGGSVEEFEALVKEWSAK